MLPLPAAPKSAPDPAIARDRIIALKNRGQLIKGSLDFFTVKDHAGFIAQFESALAKARAALKEIDPDHLIP
ncbi:MAG: hypothetical protein WCV82_00650 [Candidatus Paceibacterota bacterium]